MKRLPTVVPAVLVTFLLFAPAALAHDGGQGTYGEADDKVVTNAGFLLIAFFPLLIFLASMVQWGLDKRKERRKAAHRKVDFGGGWKTARGQAAAAAPATGGRARPAGRLPPHSGRRRD